MFLSGSQIFVLRKKKRSIRNKKSIVEEKTKGYGRWEMGNGKEEQKLEGCVSNSNDSTGEKRRR